MSRLTVTRAEQLPQGQFFYRARKFGGGHTEFPIRRDFIAHMMNVDPIAHPAQHLGQLIVEETEAGWVWVEPGENPQKEVRYGPR